MDHEHILSGLIKCPICGAVLVGTLRGRKLMEDMVADIEAKISGSYGEKITANQLYEILLSFDKMYFKMTDIEKKQFMRHFIEEIE